MEELMAMPPHPQVNGMYDVKEWMKKFITGMKYHLKVKNCRFFRNAPNNDKVDMFLQEKFRPGLKNI